MKQEYDALSDLITQTEAARLRNVSRAAIHALVKRGRLSVVMVGGKAFVRRSEVLSFEREQPGPMKGSKPATRITSKKAATKAAKKKAKK
jgi:excisionase family DNA binding protein